MEDKILKLFFLICSWNFFIYDIEILNNILEDSMWWLKLKKIYGIELEFYLQMKLIF